MIAYPIFQIAGLAILISLSRLSHKLFDKPLNTGVIVAVAIAAAIAAQVIFTPPVSFVIYAFAATGVVMLASFAVKRPLSTGEGVGVSVAFSVLFAALVALFA